MARRHDVQNLLRRGNIWYWRPRPEMPLSVADPMSDSLEPLLSLLPHTYS